MGRKVAITKVSKPFKNPLIGAKGLNPVRKYSATVKDGKKTVETLSGVVFASQKVRDQIQHHALVRGLGSVKVILKREKLKS